MAKENVLINYLKDKMIDSVISPQVEMDPTKKFQKQKKIPAPFGIFVFDECEYQCTPVGLPWIKILKNWYPAQDGYNKYLDLRPDKDQFSYWLVILRISVRFFINFYNMSQIIISGLCSNFYEFFLKDLFFDE